MEPIRPDDDELRATRDGNAEQPKESKPKKGGTPPEKPGNGGGGGRKGRSGFWGLLAILVVAGAGAAGWYQQSERIARMESQLEEADYWARQSKLALARFEGELSETGEDLQQTGQSIEQRFSDQEERLDTADSEIRKLWGIANDRNKSRLNDHEARLDALNKTVEQAATERAALSAALDSFEESIGSQISALESSLQKDLQVRDERADAQQSALGELRASVSSMEDLVESRITRLEREQSLTIDGLEGRISSLEKATEALTGGEIESIRSELNSLKRTVESIDASRAQLTSRLVRLSEEVSQLR